MGKASVNLIETTNDWDTKLEQLMKMYSQIKMGTGLNNSMEEDMLKRLMEMMNKQLDQWK